jgi:branched-chain amino acid transport system permease protein
MCGLIVLAVFPHLIPAYYVVLIARCLIMGIAGLAFTLLFAHVGLLSFGQAFFFGLGGYTVALLMRYYNIDSLEILLLASLAICALGGLGIGSVCLKRGGIYFALLTLGFAQLLYSLVFKLWNITGGSDGLPLRMVKILGIDFIKDFGMTKISVIMGPYYYFVLASFVISCMVIWRIVNSPFGLTLRAIRDDGVRAELIGINTYRFRLAAFLISGIFTGLAGALWSLLPPFHITPTVAYWTTSFDIVLLSLIGGYQYFVGPIIGAFVYVFLKQFIGEVIIYWQLVIGVIAILIAFTFRGGIAGIIHQMGALRR